MAKLDEAWRRPELLAVTDYAENFITLFDRDFRQLFVNRKVAQTLGRDPEELIGKTLAQVGMPADLCNLWESKMAQVLATAKPVTFDSRMSLPGGSFLLETLLAPVKDSAGGIQALTAITRDVTAWKRDQALRNAQNEVMRELARGASLPELMDTMVRLSEQNAPGRLCSLLLLAPDGRHLMPGSAPNLPQELIAAICAKPIGPDNASCGAAAHYKHLVMANDLAAHEAWAEHRALAEKHGLRSCWSQAILSANGELLGTFAMYHKNPRAPYENELLVINEAALIAAIAIPHCREHESLLESEERLERALDASRLGMWDWNLETGVLFVDWHFSQTLGYEREDVKPNVQWLLDHIHPDDRQAVIDALTANLQNKTAYTELEYRGQTKAGEYRWVRTRGRVTQRNKDGWALRMSGTNQDIDGERRVQQHLQQANTRIQLLLEATDEGIIGLDPEGVCTFVNPAATRFLRLSSGQLLGKPFDSMVRHTADDGAELIGHDSPIVRCLLEGQRFIGANELFWLDANTAMPVEYSVSPLMADGRPSGAVLIFRDVSDKRALAQQLQHQALHDPLTGLVNRYGFEKELGLMLFGARTHKQQHALCYVDLDHFKLVNDTCGHAAGDELLRQLPAILQPLVRKGDTVARLGGDEFGILLEDCPLEQAARIAESVRDAVRDFRFVWQYRTFTIGASIGVVAINSDSQGLVSVLGAADAACYVAKDQGANHVHVSYPHDLAIIRRRGEMRWVARIKTALEENQFRLHYQSIAALAHSGAGREESYTRHELLLRLVDAKGDLVMPAAFMQSAERYQLMPAIDHWVIDHALQFIGQNIEPNPALNAHCFGINLSGESLRDPGLLDYIKDALKRHGVSAARLYFELTETAAISNLGAAVEFMRGLKDLGCKLALDDFGSGMSSFSYLKHLPVDYLKIDGSFIKDIVANPVDQAIVRAVTAVGQQMGIQTIAEYVENQAIHDCLVTMGVNYGQGFGIAKPMPLENFTEAQQPSVVASA